MLRRWLQDLHKRVITGRSANRGRTVCRATRRLALEALEDRNLPAPVSWINPAGGDWGTPGNWSTGAVPGAADDVTINLPGNVTVTHSANATDTVHSLVNTDRLQVALGILNVASFQNSGILSIAAGAMVAANTYTQTGGQTLLQGGTIGAFLPPETTALAFNGTDQVQVPTSSSLTPTTQLTVEAWVNASSLQNPLQGIAGTWNDINGNNRTNLLWIQFGKFAFYVSHNGSDFPNVVSTTSVQTNQWYHVAGTFDGNYLRLYVNGALEATTYSPGSISTNTLPFNIGQVNGGGSSTQYFQGQIADLSFWSVARSQSQIQADMAGPLSGPQPGLAGYWQLASAPNGTVSDQSGNNNTGTTSSPALTAAPVTGGTASIQGGTLSGTGTINGDLTNGGGVDLGGAAGVLTVRGNYTQTAAGTLTLKVGGAAASQYDQFDVLGTATLGGTLNVVLSNGFNPLHGQTFTVFNFASESGNFATVNLPTSDGVTAFTTNLNATNLTLVGTTIAPTSSVNPLPTYSSPSFTVSWSGQDNPGGSGVASFDVFVSDNGGAFVPFLTGTMSTSAVFNGQRGHTYGFYSIATDAIGNREVKAAAAEATTSVPSQVATTTALASSASSSTYGQSVTFTAAVSAALTVFGTPTGSVQFLVDGVNLGSPVALQGGTATLTTSAVPAGNHSITAVFTASTTDFAASTSGPLSETVAPAVLLLTVDNKSKVYGAALPTFTGSVSGLVNGDNITASFGTSATAASGVGTYAIVATLNDPNGRLGNYTVTNQPGTLTVTAASLSASGVNFSATAGAPFSGSVATIANTWLFAATTYSATITWGDGSTSAGVVSGSGSTLTVTGSHTYADPVNETVSVQISNPNTTTATATDTATVTSLGQGVVHGLTGDIGFWHNSNGQALINSFNGGATATALANWLAATFPNLYGATAGANNLSGKTNAQVAAFYQSQFNLTGSAQAQVLAVALNVYATTSSLGGTAGVAYGFTVSATGLGARSYNVGQDGAAFGVANNTTLNVYQLLLAVNKKAVNGVLYNGDATLQLQCADLLGALNQAGSIG